MRSNCNENKTAQLAVCEPLSQRLIVLRLSTEAKARLEKYAKIYLTAFFVQTCKVSAFSASFSVV